MFLSRYNHNKPIHEFAFGGSKTLSTKLLTIIRLCRLNIILQ